MVVFIQTCRRWAFNWSMGISSGRSHTGHQSWQSCPKAIEPIPEATMPPAARGTKAQKQAALPKTYTTWLWEDHATAWKKPRHHSQVLLMARDMLPKLRWWYLWDRWWHMRHKWRKLWCVLSRHHFCITEAESLLWNSHTCHEQPCKQQNYHIFLTVCTPKSRDPPWLRKKMFAGECKDLSLFCWVLAVHVAVYVSHETR